MNLRRVAARLRTPLMLLPALAVICLFFLGGVFVGAGQSLDYMPVVGLNRPTLSHYAAILGSKDFWLSLGLTLYLAFTSTILSVVLAVATVMALRLSAPGTRLVTFLYQIPLPVPHLVAAAGIVMLWTQSGLVARFFYAAGLLEQPGQFPVLVYDRLNIGTILVYVWKETPFIGLVILAVLRGVGHEYEEVAATLGAGAWQRFRYVLLPLILPGIGATAVIVFAFLFGSFEVPLLLGQRYPSALPVAAYRLYSDPDLDRRPESMAMGVLITIVVVLLLALYRRLARTVREWG